MIEGAATILPVSNVATSIAFYVDVLGFSCNEASEDGSFAIVACGNVAMMLLRKQESEMPQAPADNIAVYIWVKDIDGFYAVLKPAFDALPGKGAPGCVKPPVDQPYGMREFQVRDPDGCLLLFGAETKTAA